MFRIQTIDLLLSRRFGRLFAAQFFGVVADNIAKTAVALTLITGGHSGGVAALATALFVLPYALFASVAGNMADKIRKSSAARIVKALEIPVMAFAGVALWTGEPLLLLGSMLLAGAQATFFSPIKYGVLPELVAREELVAANAWMEAGTFLGILIGTIAGGLVIGLDHGPIAGATLLALSITGAAFALGIPATQEADPSIKLSFLPLAGARGLLRDLKGWGRARAAAVGLSWFWMCGAVLLAEIPVYGRDTLAAGPDAATALLTALALGIGAGSMAFGALARSRHAAVAIPLGFIGMGLAIFAALSVPSGEAYSVWLGCASLFAAAFSGGLASVPLYVALQEGAPHEARARAVAANNLLNAIYMVIGAALAAATSLLATWAGASAADSVRLVLGLTGLLSIVAAGPVLANLPEVAVSLLGGLLLKIYRVEVRGLENLPAADQRAVFVPNHVTWLDGAFLAAALPGRPAFAVNSFNAKQWWARWAVQLVNALPLDPTNPMALKTLIREVQNGRKVVIFPEGRLTRTGALMKIYDGPAVIANRADAVILPVRIDGAETSIWTRLRGIYRRQLFPKITITLMPARRIEGAEQATGRARREALSRGLYDIMENAAFHSSDRNRTLFAALLAAGKLHGGAAPILEDVTRTPMTYRRLLLGACLLGRAFARRTERSEPVGLLLPNTNAFAAAFFGLQAFGRVPALLNYSTGADSLLQALATAEIRTVVTSRRFIELGKLEGLLEALKANATVLYLEDLRDGFSRWAKLRGLWDRLRAGQLPGSLDVEADAPAAILFTSGSEGAPKGVVLSHRGLLSNIAQARARIDFNSRDVTLNALPCFHSFGLTVGFLLPLLNGVKTVLYPNPLHYRRIPELAYDVEATILFGTDTFLTGYARQAHAYDFRSLRYVFAGAEKIRDETRRTFADRFGVRLLEGYGATETGPVLAINTAMYAKPGSVGRLMTEIEHRLEPVEGLERGGRLFVRGPNVMLGYLKADQPGVLQPPTEGWHDTGDIVELDAAGFVYILGRAKRFAKVAGEMVSLSAVEEWAATLWPEDRHAVLAAPDARKGEKLVLVTTCKSATRNDFAAYIRARRLPEIATPAELVLLEAIPTLSTGKTDYPGVKALAQARSTGAPPVRLAIAAQ